MIEAIRRKIAVTRSWFLEENAESLRQAKHNLWYIFASVFMFSFSWMFVFAPLNAIVIGLSPLLAIIIVAKIAGWFSFCVITGMFFYSFLLEENISSFNIICNDFLEDFYIFAPMILSFTIGYLYLGLFSAVLMSTINPALITKTLITAGSMSILAIFASINGIFSKGVNYLKVANRVSGYNIHIYMTLFAVIAASCVSSLIFFVPVIYTASMLIATTINMVKFKNNSMSFIQNKIQNNQLEELATFINSFEEKDKNLQYNDEYTLLEYAARNNHIEVIRAIITANWSVWVRNMELPEALIQKAALTAVMNGHEGLAVRIIQIARIAQHPKILDGQTLFEYAAKNGHQLLAEAIPNNSRPSGQQIHEAALLAIMNEHEGLAVRLIQIARIAQHPKILDGQTLLEYAAKNNCIEVVRAMMASTNKPPEALIPKAALTAAKAGNKEIADILMMRRINGNGTFLQRAIELENIELVSYLLQNHLYDKNIYSGAYTFPSDSYNILSAPGSEPAILSAAKTGNVAIAAALIAAGANPSEVKWGDNKTALQLAVENNHINLVKHLMFSKHVQFIELYTCLNQGYITRADAFEKSKQMLNMSLDDEVFCNLIRERLGEKHYTRTTAKRRDEKTILEAKFNEIELEINNPNKLSETNKEYLQNLINEYKETSNKPTEQLVTRDAFSRSLLGISNLVNLKKPATFRYMQELIVGKASGKNYAEDGFLKQKITTRFFLKKLNPDVVTRLLEYVSGPLQNFKYTQYKLAFEVGHEIYKGTVKAVEIKSITEKEEFNAPQAELKEEIALRAAQRDITLATLQGQLAAIVALEQNIQPLL